MLSERLEELQSDSWVEVERIEYAYNQNGHLVSLKEFFHTDFSVGDSISYRYNADGLIESVDFYEKLGTFRNWSRFLSITNVTYENRNETAVEIGVSDGSGGIQTLMRLVDLEWDLGYYPIVDGFVSLIVPSYSPKLFGNAKITYPSKVTIEDYVGGNWYTRSKSEFVGQTGNVYALNEAYASGSIGAPLTDSIFLYLHENSSGDFYYVFAEVYDTSGTTMVPYFKDSIVHDAFGNEALYRSSFFDIDNQRFVTTLKEERGFSYGVNNAITEIDYSHYERGFWETNFRFELFGFNKISTESILRSNACKVYPNPANEFIQIDSAYENDQSYKIMGMDGKVMKSGKTQRGFIYLEGLPSGLYILHLENGLRKKVVVKN